MSLVSIATPKILLSRNFCFSRHLGDSVLSIIVVAKFGINTNLNSIQIFSQVFNRVSTKWESVNIVVIKFYTYMNV